MFIRIIGKDARTIYLAAESQARRVLAFVGFAEGKAYKSLNET